MIVKFLARHARFCLTVSVNARKFQIVGGTVDEQRQRLINSLREFATFLESNAGAPMPCVPRFDVFCLNKEEFQSAVKSVGGRLEKRHEYGDLMCVRRHFGVVEYDINVNREQICRHTT